MSVDVTTEWLNLLEILKKFADIFKDKLAVEPEDFIARYNLREGFNNADGLTNHLEDLIDSTELSEPDREAALVLIALFYEYQNSMSASLYLERMQISGRNRKEINVLLHALAAKIYSGRHPKIYTYFANHEELFEVNDLEELICCLFRLTQEKKSSAQDIELSRLILAYVSPLKQIDRFWQRYHGAEVIDPEAEYTFQTERVHNRYIYILTLAELACCFATIILLGFYPIAVIISLTIALPFLGKYTLGWFKTGEYFDQVKALENKYGLNGVKAADRRKVFIQISRSTYLPEHDRVMARYLIDNENFNFLRVPYHRKRK